jgi:ABC-2 type transport system ATP-binding protein
MTAPIVCEGLVKRYGRKVALDGLTLEVPAGAVWALLGENGAGKSTAIKVLTGQHPPDAGRAAVLGRDAWADAVALRHRVGYVPERPRFYDWMTVDETGAS